MNWKAFEVRVPGKWVLCGEHAVLRGATAVALPLPEFGLKLSFNPDGSELLISPQEAKAVVPDLLRSVEDEWHQLDRSFVWPRGKLMIESTIPIGAGMGSSAALSVAMTRWMSEPLSLAEGDCFEFATKLEHHFHGQSSGMDVAVISAGQPISFVRGRGARALGVKRTPRFSFHDTGVRARTSDCVSLVERFREDKPAFAMKIDEAMSAASRLAVEGLMLFDSGSSDSSDSRGLDVIAKAMKQAQECFYSWGLVPTEARRLEEDLLEQGALAVKLTGAGGGGMMVALWGNKISL